MAGTHDSAMAAMLTVADLLRVSARRFPARTALCWPEGAETFAELHVRSNRLANLLGSLAVPGDRIAIAAETRREYVEVHFGVAKAGLTLVNLNWRSRPSDLRPLLDETAPRVVFYSAHTADLAEALSGSDDPAMWIRIGDDLEARLAAAAPGDPRIDQTRSVEHIHNIVYTSGSTGAPKGVEISHRAAVARAAEKAAALSIAPSDGYALSLPMFHIGGDVPLYTAALTGTPLGLVASSDPAPFVELVCRHGLTMLTLAPAGQVQQALVEHLRRHHRGALPLRVAEGQGDPVPTEILVEATARLGVRYRDSYGMSELSTVLGRWAEAGAAPSLWKDPHQLATVELADDEGAIVEVAGTAQVGELMVRSPMVASGYFGRPGATEEAFAGGWFRTGDLFTRSAEGGYRFLERRSYVIRSGGENVYPAEIEQVLARAPGVAEVYVIGIDNRNYGRVPKAFVVPAPGAQLTSDALDAFAREHLAGYKRPRHWAIVDAATIPRSPLGKALRKQLELL